MHRALCVALSFAIAAAGLTACGGDEAEWRDVAVKDLTLAQRAQVARAHAAKSALFGTLSKKLRDALGEGGGAGAITVCRDEAPRIAADVSKAQGLRIGRTSHRLRNPANAPPEWALTLVESRVENPRFRSHDDGRLGVLLPIPTMKRCLMCHGPKDAIATEVRDTLAQHYPEDAATGFTEGEMRGWFWIEVPARQAP
jgi:hypothetical protein